MSSSRTPRIASDLVTSCTAHIYELSRLSGTRNRRAPLCHEFGRFRLWAHNFYKTPPAAGDVLDEVLEETVYLKKPTILLLATFARCLLADCLQEVGNDNTHKLLELSLHAVTRAYPDLEAALQREWNTWDAAIADLRECVDALFDLVSTLDHVLEEMQEPVVPVGILVNPLVIGEGPLLMEENPAVGDPLAMGESPSIRGAPEVENPEIEDFLRADIKEPAACPVLVTGVHWEIYRENIKDKFPQAIEELDIEGLAKGNFKCYTQLMKQEEEEEVVEMIRVKASPSTIKDSGLGSSVPASILARSAIHRPLTHRGLAPSVSGLSQSTICSTASDPKNRRLLPRIPEHSPYSAGFKCTFCRAIQRPTTQGHRWRKHVFADLRPYMCIRARCPSSGTFYTSKKAWVAHDTVCIRDQREGAGTVTTDKCPFCAKGFEGDTGRFYSHVAHHMEDIRLIALPLSYRGAEEGEYHNSSTTGSMVEEELPDDTCDRWVEECLNVDRFGTRNEEVAPLPINRGDISSSSSRDNSSSSVPQLRRPQLRRPQYVRAPGSPMSTSYKPKRDTAGRTKLHRACQRGAVEDVEAILNAGKEFVNAEDNAGYQPLHDACLHGHLEVAKILIDNGAQIDQPSKIEQDTPLLGAVDNGHTDVVRYLLELGANARKRNKQGQTAMDLNESNRETEEVFEEIEGLLKAAISELRKPRPSDDETARAAADSHSSRDPSVASPVHQSPPAPSIPSGSRRRSARTKQSRKDILWLDRGKNGLQKLREKAREGDIQMVNALLERGTKPDTESLIGAIKGGHEDTVSLLLAYGDTIVDPEPGSSQGHRKTRDNSIPAVEETPMLAAIGRGNLIILGYLLANGVNPRRLDRKGRSYMDIAREREGDFWQEEVDLLQKAYDKFQRAASHGHSPENYNTSPKPKELNDSKGTSSGSQRHSTIASPRTTPVAKKKRRLVSGRDLANEEYYPRSSQEPTRAVPSERSLDTQKKTPTKRHRANSATEEII